MQRPLRTWNVLRLRLHGTTFFDYSNNRILLIPNTTWVRGDVGFEKSMRERWKSTSVVGSGENPFLIPSCSFNSQYIQWISGVQVLLEDSEDEGNSWIRNPHRGTRFIGNGCVRSVPLIKKIVTTIGSEFWIRNSDPAQNQARPDFSPWTKTSE